MSFVSLSVYISHSYAHLILQLDVKPALWISSVTSLNKNTPPTVEMAGSSDNNKKIYVGGLPLHLTNRELKEYFESFGAVTNARVAYDEENKKSRGFGFVTFDSEDVVHNVLQKSDFEMENRLLMVGRADSDRNQGLIYTYDCNNTCLGSGRSDSETYGPYPPPAPQPPYAPPYGNYSWPSGTFPDVVSWNGLQTNGGLLPYANPAPHDNSTKDDNQPQMDDKSSMGNNDVNDK